VTYISSLLIFFAALHMALISCCLFQPHALRFLIITVTFILLSAIVNGGSGGRRSDPTHRGVSDDHAARRMLGISSVRQALCSLISFHQCNLHLGRMCQLPA
jgi:hypothetical protein